MFNLLAVVYSLVLKQHNAIHPCSVLYAVVKSSHLFFRVNHVGVEVYQFIE